MWLLLSTICIVTSPLTVECRHEAARPVEDRAECVAMIAPLRDYIKEVSTGLPVVFIGVGCKYGAVG